MFPFERGYPMRNRSSVPLSVLVLVLACTLLQGQTASTGQIAGTVFDQSNAAVAGAEITVQGAGTSNPRKVISDQTGNYAVPLLSPGNYSVTVGAKGFKTQTIPTVAVNITETTTVRVQLELGQTTETITVETSANMVQTENA